ncbi:MAG: hypothetical protein WCI50_14395, partial [Actinomycetes bacterium]
LDPPDGPAPANLLPQRTGNRLGRDRRRRAALSHLRTVGTQPPTVIDLDQRPDPAALRQRIADALLGDDRPRPDSRPPDHP